MNRPTAVSAWTPDLIRIRFVEAAATESFLPGVRLGSGNGYWPEYTYDAEDQNGWDDAARLDNAAKWRGRASSDAISRHQECMDWTATRIADTHRRQLVWAYAFCRANKFEFGKLCNRKGWKKSTCYDRLNKTWVRLAIEFNNSSIALREPSQFWIGHETPGMTSIGATSAIADDRAIGPIQHPPFRTEKPRDLLRTEEDIATFQKHLDKTNERRRKLQAWRDEALAEVA